MKVILSLILCLASLSKPNVLCGTGPFLIYNFTSGMFATFASVLGALDFYEKGGYAGIKVVLDSGPYVDPTIGPNWWEYFFEPINIGEEKEPIYTFTLHDHGYFIGVTYTFRARAAELIQKYVRIKPHIQEEVQQFVDQYFKGYYVIGVHHRGTDKRIETQLVPYEKTCQTIDQIISKVSLGSLKNEKIRIYVATDDQYFLTYIKERYPSNVIYNDFVRSSNGAPLHYGRNNNSYTSNYQKGKESLVDCLLLSKCNILIRPESCLSMIADRFNPKMAVVVLKQKK